jgi:hypothetical protein
VRDQLVGGLLALGERPDGRHPLDRLLKGPLADD